MELQLDTIFPQSPRPQVVQEPTNGFRTTLASKRVRAEPGPKTSWSTSTVFTRLCASSTGDGDIVP